VGLPWATVQHALDFTTRDAANGDRFNVKAGTDDVLAAALDFTTYGTPTAAAPWILQGYTNAAGDGGIGGIDGGAGNFSIVGGDTLDFLYFVDMHLHNTGTADVISLDNDCTFNNCEIDNTTGIGLDLDSRSSVFGCHIHNCGSTGVTLLGGTVAYCTFENGARDFTTAINLSFSSCLALFNVVSVDGASDGIVSNGDFNVIAFNSVYSNAGTGEGIRLTAGTQGGYVFSNIIEGFIGAGGNGIELSAGCDLILYGYNAFYNNTANLTDNSDFILADFTANDINPLGASAFNNAAADDFTVNTSVKALAYPTANYPSLAVRSYLDIGALQREEAGGGGVAAPVHSPSSIVR
jgi:hypothetical protein